MEPELPVYFNPPIWRNIDIPDNYESRQAGYRLAQHAARKDFEHVVYNLRVFPFLFHIHYISIAYPNDILILARK
jgi:hypothetical protein